jgi:leucyl/phenylalanyl-tRNA---protein transferase
MTPPRQFFPDPRHATPEGIVAIGGRLNNETLAEAYGNGIFPWPHEGMPMLWFSPDPRGILDFSDFHVSTSLKKFSKKTLDWKITINERFPEVIRKCRLQPRKGQSGTWITAEVEAAYIQLFEKGQILSLEATDASGKLVGGIYGVMTLTKKGFLLFSAESMFHAVPNASKICFWKMVEHLTNQGHQWMDLQMVTDVSGAFGGKYIPREDFLRRIGV